MKTWGRRLAKEVKQPGRTTRAVAAAVCMLAFLGAFFSWALASAPGAFPDDDYHLPSIWCPRPFNASGCEVKTVDGVVHVNVPEVFSRLACYVHNREASAKCIRNYDDSSKMWTTRVDTGDYPLGFYQFSHLMVSDSIESSIIAIRFMNSAIAVLLLALILWQAPRRLKPTYALVLLGSWVPLGVYFVASNNPSSWSITGVAAYALALYAATQSQDRKRVVLTVLAVIGALLCFTSRADASFYVLVVSLVVWMLAKPSRDKRFLMIVSGVLSVIGLVVMANCGQSNALSFVQPKASQIGLPRLLFGLIRTLPNFMVSFWGSGASLGWLHTPLRTDAAAFIMLAVGFLLLISLRSFSVRKAPAVVVSLGALLGIPFVLMFRQGYADVNSYQTRYMLPLLAVLVLTMLLPVESKDSRRDVKRNLFLVIPAAILLILGNFYAQLSVLRRYLTGVEIKVATDSRGFLLNGGAQWWWKLPFGPTESWMLGAVAFALGVTLLLWLTYVTAALPRRAAEAAAEDAG